MSFIVATMPWARRAYIVIAMVAVTLAPLPAAAQYDWGQMATISSTLGVNANRLCVGEATRGDLGCPTYAPSVDSAGLLTTGNISSTGNISANRFIGDGSGLTGMPSTATDRISSTNNQSLAVATTGGTISFTLGGTAGAAYLHPSLGLVAAGVSTTGTISGSGGYFAGAVGIKASAGPTQNNLLYVINSDNNAFTTIASAGASSVVDDWSDGSQILEFNPAGSGKGIISSYIGALTFETNYRTPRLSILQNGNVGVGTSTPQYLLDISQTATSISGDTRNINNLLIFAPTASSTATVAGMQNTIAINGNGNTSMMQGISSIVQKNNSGQTNHAFGLIGDIQSLGAGDITLQATGVRGRIYSAGTGDIPLAIGGEFYTYNNNAGSVITNAYGVLASVLNNAGTITNGYGLSIHDVVATNAWGIYQQGADDNNYFAGKVGIATTTPTTALQVNGTLRLANGGEACDANRVGAIRYTASEFSFCRNGTAWEALSSIANNATPDRIISGTASVIANSANSRIDISGSLNLPAQNVAGVTNNAILHNGARFIHTYRPVGNDGQNLFVGVNSGNTTMISSSSYGASYNTGLGNGSLLNNTTGFNNTATGYITLYNNTTGFGNSVYGYGSMYANTTGYNNTAFGILALNANTTGAANAATGYSSLVANTTGVYNAAHGYAALYANTTGYYNTAFGGQALYYNTTGVNNTAGGLNALLDNTTGNNNTALGLATGRGITTGSNNTILGANVTGLPADLSNTIIIADGDGNRRININPLGNVGIGTATPFVRLDVDDATTTDLEVARFSSSGSSGAITGKTYIGFHQWADAGRANVLHPSARIGVEEALNGWDSSLVFQTRNSSADVVPTTRMTLSPAGNVGIGTTAPQDLLHVRGTTAAISDYQFILEGATAGYGAGVSFQAPVTGGGLTEMGRITADGENSWNTTAATQDAGLRFFTANDGVNAERMRLTSNGNVGIATTTPSARLQVGASTAPSNYGGSFFPALFVSAPTAHTVPTAEIKSAGSPGCSGCQSIGLKVVSDNGVGTSLHNIGLWVNAAGALTNTAAVFENGNVGIGTTAPQTALQVNGTLRIASGGETCDANRAGGIRYTGGVFEFCNGSAWAAMSGTDSTKVAKSGDTMTGRLFNTASQPASSGIANTTASLGGIEFQSQGAAGTAGAAFMAFHRPGAYAAYLGLDTDNQFKVGGWSMGATAHKLWHAGNDGASSGLDADTLDGASLSLSGNRVTAAGLGCGGSWASSCDANNDGNLDYAASAGTATDSTKVAKGGDTMTGQLNINNTAPTLAFQDTDQRSGFIHMNSNFMYILSSAAANAASWAVNGGYWPLTISMVDDTATFGGPVVLAEGGLNLSNNIIQGIGQMFAGPWNATYDIWMQGGVPAAAGGARNLALLGVDNDSGDTLYVNHASEYAGGTVIGGPVNISGQLRTDTICNTAGGNCKAQSALGGGITGCSLSSYGASSSCGGGLTCPAGQVAIPLNNSNCGGSGSGLTVQSGICIVSTCS